MTPFLHRLLLLVAGMPLVACTSQSLETPAEKATTPPQSSYQDYEAERKRLRGSDTN
jgi:hypothetical protein